MFEEESRKKKKTKRKEKKIDKLVYHFQRSKYPNFLSKKKKNKTQGFKKNILGNFHFLKNSLSKSQGFY